MGTGNTYLMCAISMHFKNKLNCTIINKSNLSDYGVGSLMFGKYNRRESNQLKCKKWVEPIKVTVNENAIIKPNGEACGQ